jgi:CelD/BcsL family acetyltransferase involved in cellulose biosynthesis
MSDVASFEDAASRGQPCGAQTGAAALPALTVSQTHRIEDAEVVWRALAADGVESPGQSYAFVRRWIEAQKIPARDQLFVLAELDGRPMALLPLWRRRRVGGSFYSWFPGAHVGCNAPLVDRKRLAAMSPAERIGFWQAVGRRIEGADLVHLQAVPQEALGLENPFAGLGRALPAETLYRSVFSSFAEADAVQRSKSRRKHDRQQGEKLAAMGEIDFDVVTPGEAAGPVLEEMFRQRARRFVVMGIRDPFAPEDVARFYRDTVAPGSDVDVKLHVLRLDGAIVAVRYSIAAGDRLFCLISAMSDDPAVQPGSPGKQCLLRMMQAIFDEGFRVLDMGAGFSDEKRHWCNRQIALDNFYLPLTTKGRLMLGVHGLWHKARRRIKSNERLYRLAKRWRGRIAGRSTGENKGAIAED